MSDSKKNQGDENRGKYNVESKNDKNTLRSAGLYVDLKKKFKPQILNKLFSEENKVPEHC